MLKARVAYDQNVTDPDYVRLLTNVKVARLMDDNPPWPQLQHTPPDPILPMEDIDPTSIAVPKILEIMPNVEVALEGYRK